MATERPFLVVSDLHLAKDDSGEAAGDLAELLGRHRTHEWIVNGDGLALSSDPPGFPLSESLESIFAAHRTLAQALRSQLLGGGAVTWVAGNHDAALMHADAREVLLRSLRLERGDLRICPWFLRRDGVHIEHGHRFDPDNAPVHPLIGWSLETEPLGVALTRRFIAPNAAFAFAHAHETTVVRGLVRAFGVFGARTPFLLARYFRTAFELCREASRRSRQSDATEGACLQALERFAAELAEEAAEPNPALLETLAALGPTPTHYRFGPTFMRLYFDRVFAGVLATGGGGLGFALRRAPIIGPSLLAVSACSAAYLALSTLRAPNRYRGAPEERLRQGAELIANTTQADLVVLGHTHKPELGSRYTNLGSFAYAPEAGRPYLVGEPGARPELRWYRSADGATAE